MEKTKYIDKKLKLIPVITPLSVLIKMKKRYFELQIFDLKGKREQLKNLRL
jgi:hypothetical protein